ncbi:DUF7344 domain-containing protein [Haladaptatus halobius]|uniref:DUF7344 domain-containing protein n=1 Tax=Haladaptatus halobius TaxID=2884875 RepID=UPI001D0B1103|nr:hypothetical protein [Haladaptatus halobius]
MIMLSKQLFILSNEHRRQLLIALAQRNPQSDPTSAFDASETNSDTQDQAIAMRHIHLPLLADHGIIDWDQDAQIVAQGPQFDELEPLLTAVGEQEEALTDGGIPD